MQTLSQPKASSSELEPKLDSKSSLAVLAENLPSGVSLSPSVIHLYKRDFHIFETKYFKIFFVENDVKKAVEVAKSADGVYTELSDWFKQELVTPYEIYLMPDKSSFQRATGGAMYGAVGAVTERRGTLYLLSEYVTIPAMAHEMTHVFLAKKVRERRVPVWFNEGLAQYMEYAPQLRSESFQKLIHTKVKNLSKIYSIHEMERDGMMRDSDATYLEALSLVLFLNQRYGTERLNQFLELYAQPDYHQPFGGAMSKVYGKSLSDLEKEWLEFIK